MASNAAVVIKWPKSAPVKFSIDIATSSKLISALNGDLRDNAFIISLLPCTSGNGTYNGLSILPGLNIAGSNISGRLLAAIINTCFPKHHNHIYTLFKSIQLSQQLVDNSFSHLSSSIRSPDWTYCIDFIKKDNAWL